VRAAAASALGASALLVLISSAEALPPLNTPGMPPDGHCSTTAPWCGALRSCATARECCAAGHGTTCGQACTNLSTDFQNCGACGRTCDGACRGGTCTPSHVSSTADIQQRLDLTLAVSPGYVITSATDDVAYTPSTPASATPRRPIYDVFTPMDFFWQGKVNTLTTTPLSGAPPKPHEHGGIPLNGLENVFRDIFFDSAEWQTHWSPNGSVPACDPVNFLPGVPSSSTSASPATSCVGDLYDNQIRYDVARGRFWISSGARSKVPSPHLRRVNLIAVSKTSDPNDGFHTYVSSEDWHEQADDPWFAVHNDLAIAYAISAGHPLRIYDADALANGTAPHSGTQLAPRLTNVFVNGGGSALEGDSNGTPRVAKHHAPSAMTYLVVGTGSRLEVFGIESDKTSTSPPAHALIYGPATYDDPTGFAWSGDLGDVVFDGTSLYVFSGQAFNARQVNSTHVVKLAVSPAQVKNHADLSPGEVDLALPPPPGMTIDYVAADLTSDGNIVVGFRAVAPACTAASHCTGTCTQAGPRLAMSTILYAGESAFRPARPFRTPTATCGALWSTNAARIDYLAAQADPPNGILAGKGAWLAVSDEDGRIVGLVTP
jgi:hypothetical protein